LSPVVSLVAYRVVQEALTNILKHSAARTARVALTYRDGDLAVEVLDEGPARVPNPTVTGAGLVGMRERVVSLGGHLDTCAGAEGGYAVRARLPTAERTPA
jgi:signal transduction histidine kinase